MASLFNYNTLNVDLLKETKTLKITLNRPEAENSFNTEMIFELETLFTWSATKLEINSILITSSTEYFSKGWDRRELVGATDQKVQRLMKKVQKLVYVMYFLPQTIIMDLKDGASGVGAEFALGADIRLAADNAHIEFGHLREGLVPACGGIGFLASVVPKATARKWILSSLPLSEMELLTSGYISEIYDTNDSSTAEKYLTAISKQAPVARIQAKRSLLDTVLADFDAAKEFEFDYAVAGMSMGDWRKSLNAAREDKAPEYTSARELSAMLQKERENTVSQ